MNFFNFVKQYADQIGGQFTSYDSVNSIIVVPVVEGRFQTVLLSVSPSKGSGKERGLITSKICEFTSSIKLKELLESNAQFDYSRFIIDGGTLKVETSFPIEGATEDDVKGMIQEVATLADLYEMKLTGKDIH
jgi:hypothetical protein